MGKLKRDFKRLIKKLREKGKRSFMSGQNVPQSSSPIAWTTNTTEFVSVSESPGVQVVDPQQFKPTEDKRIEKKPVEIYQEVVSEKPIMNLIDLNGQIKVIKHRRDLLKDELGITAFDENIAIDYLKARKKYIKCQKYFLWAVATQDKLKNICTKYKLRQVGIGSYYKSCPLEATDELEKFLDAYEQVRNNKPQIDLIIDDGGKEDKKDPILLGSSPFGKWWYILGAWDKEVKYVDDIVYKGK